MPSVLATLVAVATAAVLLRVAIGRLSAGDEVLGRIRLESIGHLSGEIEQLRDTLRDAHERPATGDGT